MGSDVKCRKCGCSVTEEAAEGVCPKCFLGQALQLDDSQRDTETLDESNEGAETIAGRYKLIRKIGEGGLGVVYMAEQLEPVKRRVAIKLIKPGMDSKEVVARFEVERQALALMDHPNIAKVFDGGSTNSGRPYFVMEWVQGYRLTDFCDEHRYTLDQRLQLLIQVCLGIQHAHQKGVIHRDIKPSNILISTSDGVPTPKIIDFGIAKATELRLTNKTVFTLYNQLLGTPAYMSPEVAGMSSRDIDTRSDIYSLGVLMHELLVGSTPFRAKALAEAGLDEMRRIVREEEPPRPSECLGMMSAESLDATAAARQTEAAKLMKAVRGDLDWIVMRCLEKDRNRRYETADALASDIHRHLKQEPVSASSPGRLYSFGKLVRRNKLAFGAAAAIAAALLIGSTFSMLMFLREREAKREQASLRQKAEANEKLARTQTTKSGHVATFLKDMLKGVGPRVSLGRDTRLLTEILDETAKRLKQDLSAEPEVQADLLETLGNVYADLGQTENAGVIFRDMLALRRELLGNKHPQVAKSLNYVGDLLRGENKFDEAVAAHREALAIQTNLPNSRADVPQTLHFLGWALGRRGDSAEAEKVHREALAIRRELFGNTHPEVADSLHYTAECLESQKKLAAAEMLFREALAIQRSIGDARLDLGHIQQHLGRTLVKQSKMDEAESYYREAVAFQRSRFGNAHPDVARSLRELGSFLSRRGKNDEGESTTREALSIFKQLSGDHPEVIQTLEDLVRLLRQKGKIEEATEAWREIVRAQRNIPGSENIKFGKNLGNLGSILEEQGHNDEAERAYREAFAVVRKVAGAEHPVTVTAGIKLGRLLEQQGKLADAESTYSAVVQPFYTRPATPDPKALNAVAWLLATCNLSAIRDGSNALRFASQVIEVDRDYDTLATLAAARAEVGDFVAATNAQREAMKMLRDGTKFEEFSSRLSLYASNKACRDPLQPATTISAAQANAE